MRHDEFKAGRVALLAAAMMIGLGTAAAAAECAGAEAIDACLVGAWKQTGGGAVEWMRRNMPPGVTIPHAKQSARIVVFNKDGSFWTAPVSGDITIRMEADSGAIQADGNIKVQANGRWSASNGKLHLCTDEQKFEGEANITVPGGGRHAMPLNAPPSGGPTTFGYKCSGDTLETRQTIPGVADPMTTQYARTTAKGAGR